MDWIKKVTIIYHAPEALGGVDNSRLAMFELRLRSDGKPFFRGKRLRTALLSAEQVNKSLEKWWDAFLEHNADVSTMTVEEFLVDAEARRAELDGAYF